MYASELSLVVLILLVDSSFDSILICFVFLDCTLES